MHRNQLFIHIVWSALGSGPIIEGSREVELHKSICGTARDLGLVPICVNSAWDHTHGLFGWSQLISIERAVQEMQERAQEDWNSSAIGAGVVRPRLEWEKDFRAVSVSPEQVDQVAQYVAMQKELHQSGETMELFEVLCGIEAQMQGLH